MKKCSLLLISACLLSIDCNANPYMELNLGVSSVAINKDLTYPLDFPSPTTSSHTSSYTNFHAQIAAGYDFWINNEFSAALEANADLYTGKARHQVNNWFLNDGAIAQEKLKYGFGLFILPSYHVTPDTRFFIGPGVLTSQFEIRSGQTGGNVGITGSFNRWLTGGGLKTGLATQIYDNTEMVLSYQFSHFNNFTGSAMEPLSEEFLKGRYSPYANTFMIGLKYAFGDNPMTGNTCYTK